MSCCCWFEVSSLTKCMGGLWYFMMILFFCLLDFHLTMNKDQCYIQQVNKICQILIIISQVTSASFTKMNRKKMFSYVLWVSSSPLPSWWCTQMDLKNNCINDEEQEKSFNEWENLYHLFDTRRVYDDDVQMFIFEFETHFSSFFICCHALHFIHSHSFIHIQYYKLFFQLKKNLNWNRSSAFKKIMKIS
jgi:hypothetical protein